MIPMPHPNDQQNSRRETWVVEHAPISKVLFPEKDRSFSSICTLSSNVEAVEAALLFAGGYTNLVSISGREGTGKSQLLDAAHSTLERRRRPVQMITSDRFIRSMSLCQYEGALIIDDCHFALKGAKQRLLFRICLERRMRSNRPTLISHTPFQSEFAKVEFSTLTRNWNQATIHDLSREDRERLVQHIAKQEGIVLSRTLSKLIGRYMNGSGRTIRSGLRRLKIESSVWIEPSQILRACGLLDIYLNEDPDWNIIGAVVDAAKELNPTLRGEFTIYTLLRVIGINEDVVCRYMEAPISTCFDFSARFEKRICRSANILLDTHRSYERILTLLCSRD
jgi:chromosomal replication initiation ATPase DnaA